MAIDPEPYYEDLHFINGPETDTSRLALVPFHKIEVGMTGAYLVKGLIPREGLIVIWGPPKCGKSFWTFDLAMHITLGWPYRGRRVQVGPIVYVACEGAHGFRARIEAFRQRHLQDHDGDVPFFLVPARLALVEDHEELIEEIRKPLGDTAPVAVVIDTLNRSITGSESSDQDMSAYVKAADAIVAAFNCAVLVVHHCGIEGTRPRGHTSLTGAADAQLAVKRNSDGLVSTKLEWMKDGPEDAELTCRLEQVEVGTDEDGEAITSCVVVEAEPAKHEKSITGYAQTAYEALVKVADDAAQVEQALSQEDKKMDFNRTSTHVRVDKWREEFRKLCLDAADIKPDTLNKRFKRSAGELERRGFIGFHDGKAWVIWSKRT
jgi:hypothetical protein